MIIIYMCVVINSLRHDPCFFIIWTPFLLVKEIHSIIYLFMMLQRIYIRKGKHFYWLAVENYVDKGSVQCFLLYSSLLQHDPCFFSYFDPFLLVKEIHSIIYLNILLQQIYICKGKHFDWLAVENYVDKGGTYCLFLFSSLLWQDLPFFCYLNPLLLM